MRRLARPANASRIATPQDYLDVEFFHLTLGLVLAVTATGAVFPRAVRRRERLPLHSI
ncbi:hypothetical protein I6A60_16630 [Frankia sp. AgB1.9]|uniref:hypothetical protein n=1 Tax=unclassified Frankia TaxID=2632575 RepID=UPI001933AD5E|nr:MULTISPECIES: hypothetical protein [unclassified Frankia]MBL7488052.1 hypothetical protein [Frankia sp. AgW1.1]MBL7549490.1 hypothetical protein [Frankia sp. AgB1.9]MBL7619894.1 hypothetical protein [Frankia sp. AgB1.8]